jgi:hypothetical protein
MVALNFNRLIRLKKDGKQSDDGLLSCNSFFSFLTGHKTLLIAFLCIALLSNVLNNYIFLSFGCFMMLVIMAVFDDNKQKSPSSFSILAFALPCKDLNIFLCKEKNKYMSPIIDLSYMKRSIWQLCKTNLALFVP